MHSQRPKKQDQPTNLNAVPLKHFCETSYCNSLIYFPHTVPVWSMEWGGVLSVECENTGVLSGECSV